MLKNTHCFHFSSILAYINEATVEIEKNKGNNITGREESVLEKLLKIDKHAALVMTMDSLLAGIDTVQLKFFISHRSELFYDKYFFIYRHRAQLSAVSIIWARILTNKRNCVKNCDEFCLVSTVN